MTDGNGVVPYEDWATPTFYDTLTAAIQELMVTGSHRSSSWPRSKPTTKTSRARGPDGYAGLATVASGQSPPAAGRGRPRRRAAPGRGAADRVPLHPAGVHPVRRVQPRARSSRASNISLFDWDGLTTGTWVGLGNYCEFFTDPRSARATSTCSQLHGVLLVPADRARAVPRGPVVADPDPRPDGRSGCCCSSRS